MSRNQAHGGSLVSLLVGCAALAGCSKEAKIGCYDAERCFYGQTGCASGLSEVKDQNCEALGYTVSCGGDVYLKPPLSCRPLHAEDEGMDAGDDSAGEELASPCAGRHVNEPLAPPPLLEDARCELDLSKACAGTEAARGLIGARSVRYPICVAAGSAAASDDCGADGMACVVIEGVDAERCRPAELDTPEVAALVSALCGPSADMDAGAQVDATVEPMDADAGTVLDGGATLSACAMFRQQKDSLGLSADTIAAIEASLCQTEPAPEAGVASDGGTP